MLSFNFCGICGKDHQQDDCQIINMERNIPDKPVPSKARLSLPDCFKLVKMSDGSTSVQCLEMIKKGTKFGPYVAKKKLCVEAKVDFMLKIFHDGNNDFFKEIYLDNADEMECNWMFFIQKADSLNEQNLLCYEETSQIYFASFRDIEVGEHLRVWYAPHYALLMKKHCLKPSSAIQETNAFKNKDIDEIIKQQYNIRDRQVWLCKFCGNQERKIHKFALHILEHYQTQMKKTCEICHDKFVTQQRLKRHMWLKHSETISNVNLQVSNKTSAASVISEKAGKNKNILGPLLLNEVADNNVLLEHISFSHESTNALGAGGNLNLEEDDTSLILNEDETFNLLDDAAAQAAGDENATTKGAKFTCDICLKNFSKLTALIKHLTAHTAKYVCDLCNVTFSRKENFLLHKCNRLNSQHKESSVKCTECDRLFYSVKYLNRHMLNKHPAFICSKFCKKSFKSRESLDQHECVQKEPERFACNFCTKTFRMKRYLNRHVLLHNVRRDEWLCEICSKNFSSGDKLSRHMETHNANWQYSCLICNRKFARKRSLDIHVELHKNEPKFECELCHKRFAVRNYLTKHLLTHSNSFEYACDECPRRFHTENERNLHCRKVHEKRCTKCGKSFDTLSALKRHAIEHFVKKYPCPKCDLIFSVKSSVSRHLKQKHTAVTLKSRNTNSNNKNASQCDQIVTNILTKENANKMETISTDFVHTNREDQLPKGKTDSSDKTFAEIEAELNKLLNGSEESKVYFSMPELGGEHPRNYTFGESTYILNNIKSLDVSENNEIEMERGYL